MEISIRSGADMPYCDPYNGCVIKENNGIKTYISQKFQDTIPGVVKSKIDPMDERKLKLLERAYMASEYEILVPDNVKEAITKYMIMMFAFNHSQPVLFYISPIFILPKYQNQGIGYVAIQKVFLLYPDVKVWKLDTILQEPRNCHLYEKCGFVRVGEEHIINDKMTLVDYERR